MGVLETLTGPLTRWLDRRVVVGAKGSARLCAFDHVPIFTLDEDLSRRKQPLHLDVSMEFWNKSLNPVALLAGSAARVGEQALREGSEMMSRTFEAVELPVGAKPAEAHFYLRPLPGEELRAKPGDRISLWFQPNRGRRPIKVEVPIVEPEPADGSR